MKTFSIIIFIFTSVSLNLFSQFVHQKNTSDEWEKGELINGVKVGCWVFYDHRGYPVRIENYNKKGELHGYFCQFSNDGKLLQEKWFENNRTQGTQTTYQNGLKKKEFNLYNSKLHGTYMTFHPNGNPDSAGVYHNGLMVGPWVTFFDNGNKKHVVQYNDSGEKDGKETHYYQNGRIMLEYNWVKNQIHGKYTQYHKSGSIELEGNYVYNSKEGKWIEYDPTGRKIKTRNYKNNSEL